jgi:hypothetical protein
MRLLGIHCRWKTIRLRSRQICRHPPPP